MILPGLVDVHVHLRTPGGEHKEDFRTGTQAASAGGFTTLLAMPNTQPPLVTQDQWRIAQTRAKNESLCDVFLIAGASENHLEELQGLSQVAPALKVYLDETYGPLRVRGLKTLKYIMQVWPGEKPICFHAEGESIPLAIGLCAIYGKPIHICHVSRRIEIELIAEAKSQGLPVTCEVTPHHLFLTQSDANRLGNFGDMRPTLASESDRQALWEHIFTTVDCVASDHAPHTRQEKSRTEGAPPGVPGLESTLPLLLTAVSEGLLSRERLADLLSKNPRKIFRLPEQTETFIEVDENARFTFPDHTLYTKCGWSPFEGKEMVGKLNRVVLRGQEVFRDGQLIASNIST